MSACRAVDARFASRARSLLASTGQRLIPGRRRSLLPRVPRRARPAAPVCPARPPGTRTGAGPAAPGKRSSSTRHAVASPRATRPARKTFSFDALAICLAGILPSILRGAFRSVAARSRGQGSCIATAGSKPVPADEDGLVAQVRQPRAGKPTAWRLTHDEALAARLPAPSLASHGAVADSPRSAIPDPSNDKTPKQLRRRRR